MKLSSKLTNPLKWMIIRSAIPPLWMTLQQFANSLQINGLVISQWQAYGTGVEQRRCQSIPWFVKWLTYLAYRTVIWQQILTHPVEHQGHTTPLFSASNWSPWWKMVVPACAPHLRRELNSVCSLSCKLNQKSRSNGTWQPMIVHDSSWSNESASSTIIDYHRLSWTVFGRGLMEKVALVVWFFFLSFFHQNESHICGVLHCCVSYHCH